jgi:hypothetical protein
VTPAEHRAEAEANVDWLEPAELSTAELIALAQVHATLALTPTATPPPARPKPAQRVEVLDVELRPLAVITTNGGGVVLSHPSSDWATLLDDPAQVRLLADTLTAHADRMENR